MERIRDMEQIYKSRPNQTSPQLNCDNDLGSASRPKLARTRQTTAPIPGVTGRHSAPYSLSAISSPMEIVCRKRTEPTSGTSALIVPPGRLAIIQRSGSTLRAEARDLAT